jgi:hypothetical protein
MHFKKKSQKISKGYRLKPATHRIIYRIQEVISGDQDEAIAKACRMYYRSLLSKQKIQTSEQIN